MAKYVPEHAPVRRRRRETVESVVTRRAVKKCLDAKKRKALWRLVIAAEDRVWLREASVLTHKRKSVWEVLHSVGEERESVVLEDWSVWEEF